MRIGTYATKPDPRPSRGPWRRRRCAHCGEVFDPAETCLSDDQANKKIYCGKQCCKNAWYWRNRERAMEAASHYFRTVYYPANRERLLEADRLRREARRG